MNNHNKNLSGSKKRGFLLHEAMMAVGLSMALVVGVTQLLVMVAQQRRLARQYTLATQEAGNVMEEVTSRPWIDTTSEGLASIGFSETCGTLLPEASLAVDVADEEAGVRRISVEIQWQPAPERARESVGLVGWKFLGKEDGP